MSPPERNPLLMLTPDQTKARIIGSLLLSAERLECLVVDLSDDELAWSSAPGSWTIRQIVHHVADDGDAWSMPLKKAIATPGAPIRFEGFPGNDAWADALAFHKRPIEASLELLKAHRHMMAELARWYADDWDAPHIVIVDSEGREVQKVTFGQILGMVTEHMLEHVAEIEKIRQAHGRSN